jgi:hypothetical protein
MLSLSSNTESPPDMAISLLDFALGAVMRVPTLNPQSPESTAGGPLNTSAGSVVIVEKIVSLVEVLRYRCFDDRPLVRAKAIQVYLSIYMRMYVCAYIKCRHIFKCP